MIKPALILLACAAALNACGGVAGAPPPQPRGDAVYTLRTGQGVAVAPDATLTLERVNDSRCRTGAVCVWAGHISFSFALGGQDGATRFVLAEAMPGAAPSVTLRRLTFTLLGFTPAAPPALDAPAPDYRVSVRVRGD